MRAPTISRFGRAAVLVASIVSPGSSAWAAGAWHGGVFHPASAPHAMRGGLPAFGGAGRFRRLPPISGVIHEGRDTAPWLSSFGHTTIAAGAASRAYGNAAYGHVGTALRQEPVGRSTSGRAAGYGLAGRGFDRPLGGGRRVRGGRFFGGGGFGDYGPDFLGAPGVYGDAGVYGGQGVDRGAGGYGGVGVSGAGTTATQSVYGSGPGAAYLSEVPLAVRYAEPPLAPSPYAPYSPADRYAYAASEDVGPGPRVVPIHGGPHGCGCASRAGAQPVVYRYGVGTAY